MAIDSSKKSELFEGIMGLCGMCFICGLFFHWLLVFAVYLYKGSVDKVAFLEFDLLNVNIDFLRSPPETWTGLYYIFLWCLGFFGPVGLFGLPFFLYFYLND